MSLPVYWGVLFGAPAPSTARRVFWYVADDIAGNDGDSVITWSSHEGHGPDLTAPPPPSSFQPPTLRLDQLNGHRAVDEWSTGSQTSQNAWAPEGSPSPVEVFNRGGMSVFAVAEPYANSRAGVVWLGGPAPHPLRAYFNIGVSGYVDGEVSAGNDAASTGWWFLPNPVNSIEPFIAEWRFSVADPTNAVRVNGVDIPVDYESSDPPPNESLGPSSTFTVGLVQAATGSRCLHYELIVYDGVLTGGDLATVRSYLSGRYGLPS